MLPIRGVQPLREPGWMVTNPPYGKRISASDEAPAEFAALARSLHGSQVAVLSSGDAFARALPFRPDREHTLFNGDLECKLLTYSIR